MKTATVAKDALTENALTGRMVLLAVLSFFLVVIAVNGVFIWLALSSFPGEDTQHAYMQGIRYNETLNARLRQGSLGWTAALERTDRRNETAVIVVRFRGPGSSPLDSLRVKGELRRPARAGEDVGFAFVSKGEGVFEARTGVVAPGAWDLRVSAEGVGDERFEFVERIVLQ